MSLRRCKNCGDIMEGDGYTVVLHCPSIDVIGSGVEPDGEPVYCWDPEARIRRNLLNNEPFGGV